MAEASPKELTCDYEDYLRHRNLEEWPPNHPALIRFKAKWCSTPTEVQAWVKEERKLARTNVAPARERVRAGPWPSV